MLQSLGNDLKKILLAGIRAAAVNGRKIPAGGGRAGPPGRTDGGAGPVYQRRAAAQSPAAPAGRVAGASGAAFAPAAPGAERQAGRAGAPGICARCRKTIKKTAACGRSPPWWPAIACTRASTPKSCGPWWRIWGPLDVKLRRSSLCGRTFCPKNTAGNWPASRSRPAPCPLTRPAW